MIFNWDVIYGILSHILESEEHSIFHFTITVGVGSSELSDPSLQCQPKCQQNYLTVPHNHGEMRFEFDNYSFCGFMSSSAHIQRVRKKKRVAFYDNVIPKTKNADRRARDEMRAKQHKKGKTNTTRSHKYKQKFLYQFSTNTCHIEISLLANKFYTHRRTRTAHIMPVDLRLANVFVFSKRVDCFSRCCLYSLATCIALFRFISVPITMM